uniref:Uncharacterized protein n=1 Tax=Vitis vinifera TaxID=29760 RepID=F6GXT1_VITVI
MRTDPTLVRKMTTTLRTTRMPRVSRSEKSQGDEGEVVDAEVGVVLAYAKGGLGEGLGAGESVAVDELGPGAALSEAVADGIGDVGDK